MTLPRPTVIPPSIPSVSLANLALLAVFYFLLTSGYDLDPAPVRLPVSDPAVRVESGDPCLVLSRRLPAGGVEVVDYRFFDGASATRALPGAEAVWLEASRVVDRDPGATFVVKADAELRWAVVDDAVESLRKAGARRVVFRTARAAAERP